jgi:hypothetical protein
MLTGEGSAERDQWRLAAYVADRFSRSIEHADQKAALLSAAIGIVLLALGAFGKQLWISLHPDGPAATAALGLLLLFALFLSLATLLTGMSLFPRMSSSTPNPFYFGDVVVGDPQTQVERLLGEAAPERLLAAGSYDLARIALAKHRFFQRAAYLFGAALAAFMVWLAVATIALSERAALG